MADGPTIAELAQSIADGLPVDWASVEAAASEDAERAAIDRLKRIAQIGGRQRSPGGPGTFELHATASNGDAKADDSRRWGHLTILEKIGEGAFGEVYRAHDPKLARDVALKLLRAPAPSAPDATSAIEEGRLLARIRHPNVVTVYGADRLDGRVGVWMEFVRGRTLEQEIQERGPFDVHQAAQIGVELTWALAAVHAAGLVHRDVKAQNVMREEDGRLVLMDFGTGREQVRPDVLSASDLAGTPLYVAPEVLDGESATARSDIYSLGVLLFHLVTGSYPTTADTISNLLAAHRAHARTSLAEARPDLPTAFVEAVDRAVMADPTARYGTALEMETALSRVIPATASSPSRPRWLVSAGVIVVAVAVLLLARPWWTTPPARPSSVRNDIPPAPGPAELTYPEPLGSLVSPPVSVPKSAIVNWVLIAAFDNPTKAAELERWFVDDLRRELSDQPSIQVASPDRIREALGLMRRPANARLDTETAQEVCQRDGHIGALITGHAAQSAHGFSLTAQVINPVNGTVIANISGEAADEYALPAAIRQQALEIRSTLAEHLQSVPRDQPRLAHVTTGSIDALKLYTLAITPSDATGSLPAQPVAERNLRDAIAADQDFAMAHLQLAVALKAQYRPSTEYESHLERARQLAEKTTVAERDVVEGITHYWRAQALTGDARQAEARLAATAFEAALLIEPSDSLAFASLNSVYGMLGVRFDPATILAPSADSRPLNFSANIGAAALRANQGDLEGANHYWQRAANVEDPKDRGIGWFWLFPSERDWAKGLAKQASQETEVALKKADSLSPNARANLMRDAVERLTTLGRMKRATQVAESIAEDQLNPRTGAIGMVLQRREARDELSAFMMPHATDRVGYQFRELWLPAGRLAELTAVMKLPISKPDPVIDIEIAFAENRFPDAVQLGEAYLDQKWEPGSHPALRVATTVGRALVAMGNQDVAMRILAEHARRPALVAAEDNQGYDWMRLRADLAALYRTISRIPDAKAIEQDLLKRLSAADPDFPLLVELKRRAG